MKQDAIAEARQMFESASEMRTSTHNKLVKGLDGDCFKFNLLPLLLFSIQMYSIISFFFFFFFLFVSLDLSREAQKVQTEDRNKILKELEMMKTASNTIVNKSLNKPHFTVLYS